MLMQILTQIQYLQGYISNLQIIEYEIITYECVHTAVVIVEYEVV